MRNKCEPRFYIYFAWGGVLFAPLHHLRLRHASLAAQTLQSMQLETNDEWPLCQLILVLNKLIFTVELKNTRISFL